MIDYECKVSEVERDLLLDLEEVEFGEVMDVEVPEQESTVTILLTKARRNLIDLLHSGIHYFHVIKVHEQQPAFVVHTAETKRLKLKYRKKVLLS